MQAPIRCPSCGEFKLYRSRSRNLSEKLVKRFLPFKIFRCHNCNWRGWIAKSKLRAKKPVLKSVFFYIGVFFVAVIVAWMMKHLLH